MKLSATVLLFSFLLCMLHIHAQTPALWMTEHHTKKTLAECAMGDTQCSKLYTTFKASEHDFFFTQLETLVVQSPATCTSARTTSPSCKQDLEHTLFKLQNAIHRFCKEHSTTAIAKILHAWNCFHFSKIEKETLTYFEHLQQLIPPSSLSPLEHKLLPIVTHAHALQECFLSHRDLFPSFYQEHGLYLIHLHTYKVMLQLFEHTFDPVLFHHVETYLTIAQKQAAFLYNDALLNQFFDGHIKLTTYNERKAKKLLKPLFTQLACRLNASSNDTLSISYKKIPAFVLYHLI